MSGKPQETKGRVLIIDDDPAITALIAATLSRAGYVVTEAHDGAEGIRQARDTAPDLILLDIIMPGMDGYQTAEQLVNDPATAEIPILFVTGRTMEEDGGRAFQHGGSMFVRKPFSPSRIVELIDVAMLSLKQAPIG